MSPEEEINDDGGDLRDASREEGDPEIELALPLSSLRKAPESVALQKRTEQVMRKMGG